MCHARLWALPTVCERQLGKGYCVSIVMPYTGIDVTGVGAVEEGSFGLATPRSKCLLSCPSQRVCIVVIKSVAPEQYTRLHKDSTIILTELWNQLICDH